MGLQQLDANGNMTWHCHSGMCKPLTAHISHPQVQHTAPGIVSLPACTCGKQMHLKVDFSAEDLKAPNMIDRNGRPTPSYAMAQRHMQLVQQLEAAGKAYTTPEAAHPPLTAQEQHALLLFQKLGYAANSLEEVGALIEQHEQAPTTAG